MQMRKYLRLREVFLFLSLFFLTSNLLFANSLPNFTSIVDKNIDAVVIVNAKKNVNDSKLSRLGGMVQKTIGRLVPQVQVQPQVEFTLEKEWQEDMEENK